MPEPQLSVRSARAKEIAHRLALREKRSIADIVERALEAYEFRETGREPAAVFYRRLAEQGADDIHLEEIIQQNRKPNPGIDL
ncbi:MAG: plasmid stabilization protein [Rhizobiaceae bacterium]|nr:plasmid stabilization protein [Rhizobiaceae bacterium]